MEHTLKPFPNKNKNFILFERKSLSGTVINMSPRNTTLLKIICTISDIIDCNIDKSCHLTVNYFPRICKYLE